ncbi:unnamed protein product [Linum tenue]|uniref:Uncharacterized protein n=1 Tax=Linum tenue TaxID=586396 RepID=A0AAV0IBL5_9ROSI|nr:unnamed protein product [Linum tenue]
MVFPLWSNYMFDYDTQRDASRVIDRVSEFIGKEVVPVGPLVRDDSDSDNKVVKWLNEKDPSTAVAYISFGSESYLSAGRGRN